ncbi:DUF6602 domain-containing protein [Photobacterium kishitanii]|uniref:DUF6602 domain-containing protein n=1 Tax=Photobacterium kishitanii TaxID=318456 RepID=A0AAX0YUM3_9GAMM|nr:DUF6602 domain-containing protein [Photobacterium kishitanii]PSX20972.1 hypothetical protein C0W70_01695 [Photobacterium kishitanii]PSX29775.1 hypothetical protein C0W52_00025 [Photobacterium kishitanii]PSX35187.1 hypothetical protein C0W39_01695 [Photobacterium kishitanii]PSX45422.1 hypothetical protein C0W53_09365 [Photobacterium kishitanii]
MKKFPIFDVYSQEADRLLHAKKSVKLIHSTGDIDASGDELEIPFREMLSRRLPSKYFVGHGHIVDQNLNVSPQYDVIIADSNATPILYEGENGTQYFPYESVYVVGELKSSFYKNSDQVKKFASNVETLLTEFFREDVPSNYIGNGITLGRGFSSSTTVAKQNEILSFMVFGSKNDFTEENLKVQLQESDGAHPTLLCFLDGSVVVKANIHETARGMNLGPLALGANVAKSESLNVVSIHFNNELKSASSLTVLMLSLFQHLNRTLLKEPPFDSYVESILAESSHNSKTVKKFS